MLPVQMAVWLPEALWDAVQLLASDEGNANAVVVRALEEYLATAPARAGQSGEYQALIGKLSRPIADLHLSPRAANALARLDIRYIYELVAKPQWEIHALKGVGLKSRREVQAKLATLGLSLGMAMDELTYRGAVLAAIMAGIRDAKRGSEE